MSETAGKVIRIAVLVIVSAAVGILLGQLVSNYELRFMMSREYLGEVNGVEIYSAGKVNEDNLELHRQMLMKAPEKLTECCDRIYFTGSDLELPASDSALGLTQNRTIFVSTESFSSYVVFHELFHAYDNAHGELSAKPEFGDLYELEKGAFPVFARYSSAYPSEFFAQAGALYLIMPTELSIAAPEVYEYFDDALGGQGG